VRAHCANLTDAFVINSHPESQSAQTIAGRCTIAALFPEISRILWIGSENVTTEKLVLAGTETAPKNRDVERPCDVTRNFSRGAPRTKHDLSTRGCNYKT